MANSIEEILSTLTEKEKEEALKILGEFSNLGNSPMYKKILLDEYEEIPVDIETFLHDTNYLGKGLISEEGKFTVFPYWENTLHKIFPDPLQPAKYNTVALTGAIGLGKSFVAVICMLYELYRMLCLKDPYLHYGLQPIDKITFAVMNITLDAAKGVAWDKLQQLLQCSPWFMSHGTVTGTQNQYWNPPKGIELIFGSLPRHIIGRAVFSCFMDEVSFQTNSNVEIQKQKAKELVSSAIARMQSRFMKGSVNPTLMLLASSKRTEQSYMETFIAEKKQNESKTTLVIDEPQWVIRNDKDSPIKFKVAVGNKFLSSEVLPLNCTEKDVKLCVDRGYTIIDVPIGYYEQFIDDIDIALTDIAGISTTNSSRYISGQRIVAIKTDSYKNPFRKEIIEVGNAKEDTAQYSDFFDLSCITDIEKSYPLYIHLDMSISGDKTGIGGTWVTGIKPPKPGEVPSKDLLYKLAFHVSIKAPKGYQVSFDKNKQFIYWLREQGFNIKKISADTYQSAAVLQELGSAGFNCDIVSVDRCENNICKPYQYLRSIIYDERLVMYENDHLTQELLGLERNNNTGKVDHSSSGINSKDSADALCGSVWCASQNAEYLAFECSEDISLVKEISSLPTYENYSKPINTQFEEMLKSASVPQWSMSEVKPIVQSFDDWCIL